MNRREFLLSSAGFAGGLSATLGGLSAARAAGATIDSLLGQPQPFSRTLLLEEAKKLAAAAYVEPPQVAERFANLPFEQYRDIRFRNDKYLWATENRGFQASLLHTGFIYRQMTDVYLVADGQARKIAFSRDLFDYPQSVKPPDDKQDLGFSGFKLRRPGPAPDTWTEFVAFQGATFFRAIAQGQMYGLSARGLAINVGEAGGEEFPTFEHFWIETPEPNASSVVVHALLNSRSTTGVYRFTLRPDTFTTIDVELSLFPREDLTHVGLGALTSMFLYDATSRVRFDDFRPAVHGSDGLAVLTGGGELIWRPLANPKTLQISAFGDLNPHGFGLLQRHRNFDDFSDLDARYDLKPSCWVEPIGDWGQGAIELIEIPSDSEIHDNILCNWRPQAKLPAGQNFSATYRMHWGAGRPITSDLAIAVNTAIGQGSQQTFRKVVIDFAGTFPAGVEPKADVSASAGKIQSVVVKANPIAKGFRVSFELDTKNTTLSELRAILTDGNKRLSETWLYRWTAG
ncbi:MAG: glucan biosynthesis protein [Ancalomicrobiaceae bacterium]|nr:glucan biosynthesis protein [Ancalomicrobiaceae bacterium]